MGTNEHRNEIGAALRQPRLFMSVHHAIEEGHDLGTVADRIRAEAIRGGTGGDAVLPGPQDGGREVGVQVQIPERADAGFRFGSRCGVPAVRLR